MADYDFGTAEKISLEIDKSHVAGLMKLAGRFEFFRQHLAFRRPKPAHHASPFLRPGCPNVDFDDVGKLDQGQARIVGREVVEGDEVAKRLEPLAGSDDAVFRLNRFQNFRHVLVRGQQRNQILEQDLTGAVHKGAALIAKRIDTEKQGTIQSGAGGKFRVGVEVVFDAVAEQNLVPVHVLRPVKNWLAGNEALPR